MRTIIIWYRNDLRVHDLPALAAAAAEADFVVPVFVLSSALLAGKHASANRNRFLQECLEDLRKSLTNLGAGLVVRQGHPEEELLKLAAETGAEAVYYTSDYTPFAITRDRRVKTALDASGIELHSFPGRLAVDSVDKIATKSGTDHKVFTPFWRAWSGVERRAVVSKPAQLKLPPQLALGEIPQLAALATTSKLSPKALPGGETAARGRLEAFLQGNIAGYHQANNDLAADSTSRLSAYLHFGCLSPREIETMLPAGDGAAAWHRQLAWREFYHYILFKNPSNATQEFQERYRSISWDSDPEALAAWQTGHTGYPAVDAAMRQLNAEGWMHNRARLIVGSFLSKDLWLDWRLGERYFMQMLIDGDEANNNGNWQWIASVGVDPAPVYRRLYNPSTQRDKFDPTGEYVRRYVPELSKVPDKYLSSPWLMPLEVQQAAGCIIGKNYPEPIVDHKLAREAALERYRV